MKTFLKVVLNISKVMNVIAGVTLTLMMLLTVSDVILRYLRMPIMGSYEMVSFAMATAIGFSLPFTSWVRGHVGVDSLLEMMPKRSRYASLILTRSISILFFALAGVFLLKKAMYLRQVGQVSVTLAMPYYPVALGVGVCCFSLCLVLVTDIVKIIGGEYE